MNAASAGCKYVCRVKNWRLLNSLAVSAEDGLVVSDTDSKLGDHGI